MKGKNAIAYVLYNIGCVHPFIFSRIIALAELKYMGEKKGRLTDLKYAGTESAFYIQDLNEIIDKDECFKRHEGDPSRKISGCIEYLCDITEFNEEIKYLDDAIDRAYDLDETELNTLVIKDKNYGVLIGKKNWQ